MDFILNHWHCVLPVIGIVIASFFMRKKPNVKETKNDNLPARHNNDN